jgi:hypothetical protein
VSSGANATSHPEVSIADMQGQHTTLLGGADAMFSVCLWHAPTVSDPLALCRMDTAMSAVDQASKFGVTR